eukprot:943550-Prymnesium_polylepis.1
MHQPFAPLPEDTPPDVQVEPAAVSPCGDLTPGARHGRHDRTRPARDRSRPLPPHGSGAQGGRSPWPSLFTLASRRVMRVAGAREHFAVQVAGAAP